jgi:magnesium-transporting ATPase (P-type)
LAKEHPRRDIIPFESDRQFMATLNVSGSEFRVHMKGAVEKVLARCSGAMGTDGRGIPLDADAIQRQVEEWASKGFRVLAFAEGERSSDKDFNESTLGGLTFLGLQAIMDPPRSEAQAAVTSCVRAGIRVIMITGDHVVTARAIAAQLGLGGGAPQAMTGAQLAALTDEELFSQIEDVSVFARVDPAQKMRLIQALQRRGHVVAMTGDGVNDAPALRRADIGVAMGRAGTDVARDASDMLLLDDNFATLEAAVEEGRAVFDNLAKFITWTLPTNLGAGLLLILAIALALPLPLLPVQALWINMMTSVCLGLMLAFEPAEPGLMDKPPRDPNRPILDKVLMIRTFLVSVLIAGGGFFIYEWLLKKGESVDSARTAVVALVVVCQSFYLFNCRSLTKPAWTVGVTRNPWVMVGVSVMLVMQALFSQTPLMNRIFHTTPLSGETAGMIMAIGFVVFVVMEAEKMVRSKK